MMTTDLPPPPPTEQTLQQAVARHQAGRWQEAEELYRAILQTRPDHPEANHNMGVLAGQMKRAADGLPYFLAALEADPTCRQYWLSYIDALIQVDQLEDARQVLALARQQGLEGDEVNDLALRLEGDSLGAPQSGAEESQSIAESPALAPGAPRGSRHKSRTKTARPDKSAGKSAPHQGTGPSPQEMDALVALFNGGRFTEAAALARTMTERFPRHGFGWKVLGAIFKHMGRSADALAPMQTAAALLPDDADAHGNLGASLQDLGRPVEAEASLRRALQIRPDHAQAHSNLGLTLQALGRLDEAEASLRRALQIKPDLAQAHNNLGNILKGLGRLNEAEASYRRALQIDPDNSEAHYNLGITLHDLGRLDEAEASYRRALQVAPDNALAHNNLGSILKDMDRLEYAEASYRRALQINPNYADAHNNLGATLMAQGSLDEAETSYRRALALNPASALAHSNLGVTLMDLGQLDEAVACFRRALEIEPDFAVAHGNLLFALNYHPDLSAEAIYQAYQEFDAQRGVPLRKTWRTHCNDRNPQRRLRIGYVSPDFRHHSSRSFLEPLLAHHDKTQVEVHAYAELVKEDYMTARYRSCVEHWIPTHGMSDDALAERIRSDGIDILIELAGHTAGNRLPAFARKPAPISLSWLGYGYTTGLSAIDYYLTDEASAPTGSDGLFAEVPWRIATPAYSYRAPADMGEVNSLPAQHRGHITFGTLTRSIRVNHRTIRVWAEILKAVPDSRLVMDSRTFKDAAMQDRLAGHFARHGIARDRLEIGFHSPPWDVLRGIDIGLDCFPHNSGTTLFETLYMGVPYITLAGRPSVGRLGSSILQGVGHPEWIADSEDGYVAKAVDLASDLGRLSTLRSTLRSEMENSPLCDEEGFARRVEEAYRGMWQIWCKALPGPLDAEFPRGRGIEPGAITADSRPEQAALPTTEQALQQAVARHQAGRWQEAEELYRAILQTRPDHPEANHNMGVLAGQMKRAADGLPYFLAALEADPTCRQYWLSYIDALIQVDQLEDARQVLALARQQGLEGDEVNDLALRLEGDSLGAPQSGAEESQSIAESPALAPGAPRGSRHKSRTKTARPDKSAGKSAPHQGTGPSPQEMDALVALFNGGRLTEAAALARTMTERFPRHWAGWKMLGVVFQQLERSADALEPMQKAAALSPKDAETHNNLGIVLADLGRLGEAEVSYRRALQIKPGYAQAHSNLGATLQDLGRLDEAEASYRRALKIDPEYAKAYSNLGAILQELDRLDEAEASYRRALEVKADFSPALENLAVLFNAQGRTLMALNTIRQALQVKETEIARSIFVACVKRLRFTNDDNGIRATMVCALAAPWGRPSELTRAGTDLVRLNPDIEECVARATRAWPVRLSAQVLFGSNGLTALATDTLLLTLLESAPNCDMEMERFLTLARSAMLETATRMRVADGAIDTALTFYSALARQCFINEYVFSHTDDEIRQAGALRDSLLAALQAGTQVPAIWPLAVAAYFPLCSLPHAARLMAGQWPDAVSAVLVQQVLEPAQEQELRASTPRLTAIDDVVSLRVQSQYEENPYPRWVKAAPPGDARNIVATLCQKFPLASFDRSAMSGRVDVLIAGCGTGQHSIGSAQRIQGAQVLAVDLSLSSLAYARRKTQELGLTSIDYAQADLLKLGSLGRSFDVIESSGVLHHLADPFAGWHVLLSLLRPGGFMKLGFYSEIARRNIVRIRTIIAEQAYASVTEDIRRCRQDLMGADQGADFGTTLSSPDFFSISTCRDLLFHVQEHRMTLSGIKAFLRDNKLALLGFEIDVDILHAYRRRFPDDPAATNLDRWQIFENENPDTFFGMYQFWIQKRA